MQPICTNMPANKLASFRYRVIDKCLSNKYKKYTLDSLLSKISQELQDQFGIDKGVSRRTFFNDINIMRSPYPRGFDAPIVCKNGYYVYDDPDYSIMHSPYNEEDLASLEEAVSLLEQFKGLPQMESMYGVLGKLKAEMVSFSKPLIQPILLDTNNSYVGTKWIEPLYQFIREEKCIQLFYKPFIEEKEYTKLIHPYLLKEYNNRWFLLGWNQEDNSINNFALDRIVKVKKIKGNFNDDNRNKILDYFNNIIGVSLPRNSQVEKIILKVDDLFYPYLETKPLHNSQRLLYSREKKFIVELQLIPNAELEFWLMQYVDRIEVIQPLSLRKSIKKRIETANIKWSK